MAVAVGQLKKVSRRIDINGNEIDPKTGEVVGNVEEKGYTPTKEEFAILAAKKGGEEKLKKEDLSLPNTEPKPFSIENLIEKKIEAIIEKKISDVLEKMLK